MSFSDEKDKIFNRIQQRRKKQNAVELTDAETRLTLWKTTNEIGIYIAFCSIWAILALIVDYFFQLFSVLRGYEFEVAICFSIGFLIILVTRKKLPDAYMRYFECKEKYEQSLGGENE